MRNQNTHKNMKHTINNVVKYLIYVLAVIKTGCKKHLGPSWLDLTTIRWLTCALDHCAIAVCVKCIPYFAL